jgi:hypothetical protein
MNSGNYIQQSAIWDLFETCHMWSATCHSQCAQKNNSGTTRTVMNFVNKLSGFTLYSTVHQHNWALKILYKN